jgi:hypothetical protein
MAKRRTKEQDTILGVLLVLGVIVVVLVKFLDVVGVGTGLIVCAVVIGGFIWLKISQNRDRLAFLRNKYGDESIVQAIIRHSYWQGQTAEQLIDSLGNPLGVDQRVLKTKKREIWRYRREGANRFGLRITLDEDTVVGWDDKAHNG